MRNTRMHSILAGTLLVPLLLGYHILKIEAPSGAQPDRVAVSKAVFV